MVKRNRAWTCIMSMRMKNTAMSIRTISTVEHITGIHTKYMNIPMKDIIMNIATSMCTSILMKDIIMSIAMSIPMKDIIMSMVTSTHTSIIMPRFLRCMVLLIRWMSVIR